MLCVLSHLQAGDSDATGVGCLTRTVEDLVLQEDFDTFRLGRHVSALANEAAPILDQGFGVFASDLILCG
jgi:hypothetical protein